MVGEVVCGLYDEVEVGVVVVFEDFGDVYGGVGVEVELVGDGACALVFALVEFACLWCVVFHWCWLWSIVIASLMGMRSCSIRR